MTQGRGRGLRASQKKENHSRSFERPTFKMKQKACFESYREIFLKEAVAAEVRKDPRDQLARRPGCRTRPGRFHHQLCSRIGNARESPQKSLQEPATSTCPEEDPPEIVPSGGLLTHPQVERLNN